MIEVRKGTAKWVGKRNLKGSLGKSCNKASLAGRVVSHENGEGRRGSATAGDLGGEHSKS